MKTVKFIIAAVLIVTSFSQVANAQSKHKSDVKNVTEAAQPKEHKCNTKCNAAAHNYLHGEKGHVCTDACKKNIKES